MDTRVFGIPTIPRWGAYRQERCELCPHIIQPGEMYGAWSEDSDPPAYCNACCAALEAREAADG
jgi:hypothetical protein